MNCKFVETNKAWDKFLVAEKVAMNDPGNEAAESLADSLSAIYLTIKESEEAEWQAWDAEDDECHALAEIRADRAAEEEDAKDESDWAAEKAQREGGR